jgi:hypothetical protein
VSITQEPLVNEVEGSTELMRITGNKYMGWINRMPIFKTPMRVRPYKELPFWGHMPLFVLSTALITELWLIDTLERDPHCIYDLYNTTYF